MENPKNNHYRARVMIVKTYRGKSEGHHYRVRGGKATGIAFIEVMPNILSKKML